MLFQEALELLKSGEKLVRQGWVESEGYLVFLHGMNHIWKIVTNPQPNAGNYIFSVNDLSADDWMKLSDREALLAKQADQQPEGNVEL